MKQKYYLNKIKNNWQLLIVVVLAISFFFMASLFNYYGQKDGFVKWSSPDETANYNVAKLYAETGDLMYFEKYNIKTSEIMHPRSYRSDNGLVKPVSFLGIILIYGKIGSIFGTGVIPYLTPLFASIGIIFFFLLIRRLFEEKIALISACLLTFFPVYIYFSSRSMFHNVLFIDLLIIGLYFGVLMVQNSNYLKDKKKKKKKKSVATKKNIKKLIKSKLAVRNYSLLQASLAGLFFGLASITRTSELIWLAPAMLLLWLFNVSKIGITKLILFIIFFIVAFLPVGCWNSIMYGGVANSGYPQLNTSLKTITSSSSEIVKVTIEQEFEKAPPLFIQLKETLFFFGFKADHAIKMFYHYYYEMFIWLFCLAILGGIIFSINIKEQKKRHWIYLLVYAVIFVVLLFYYGSWIFYDNPDPTSFTIGNSYTRYWLPLYLGAMPFASIAIIYVTKLIFRSKYIYVPMRIGIILGITLWSLYFTAYGSEEGLAPSLERSLAVKTQYNDVINLTEDNAVIITKYHDKLFHPERKIIMGTLTNDELNAIYSKVADVLPLYYYNFTFPEKDFDYLNSAWLKRANLNIKIIKQVTKDFTLYKIEKTK